DLSPWDPPRPQRTVGGEVRARGRVRNVVLRFLGSWGGSNSPSKAFAETASTSVAGDFFSRGPERAPTRSRIAPGRLTYSRLPTIGRAAPPLHRPPRPAEGRPGGRHC